jgi:hypothetical protein
LAYLRGVDEVFDNLERGGDVVLSAVTSSQVWPHIKPTLSAHPTGSFIRLYAAYLPTSFASGEQKVTGTTAEIE